MFENRRNVEVGERDRDINNLFDEEVTVVKEDVEPIAEAPIEEAKKDQEVEEVN